MLMRRRGIKTTIAYNYNDTDVTVITPAITMRRWFGGGGVKCSQHPVVCKFIYTADTHAFVQTAARVRSMTQETLKKRPI